MNSAVESNSTNKNKLTGPYIGYAIAQIQISLTFLTYTSEEM